MSFDPCMIFHVGRLEVAPKHGHSFSDNSQTRGTSPLFCYDLMSCFPCGICCCSQFHSTSTNVNNNNKGKNQIKRRKKFPDGSLFSQCQSSFCEIRLQLWILDKLQDLDSILYVEDQATCFLVTRLSVCKRQLTVAEGESIGAQADPM